MIESEVEAMDRARLIAELLGYERPLRDVLADLAPLDWDSDEPLAELKASHIRHVLARYFQAELSAAQIEEWANAIECREDIGYESSSPEGDIIFELANPDMTAQLNPARAEQILRLLSGNP